MSTTVERPSLLSEAGQTFRLALPIIIAQFALVMMNVVATVLAGKIGSAALAAAGLGNALFFSLTVIANGLVSSVGVKVAQAEGRGNVDEAGAFAYQGLKLAFLIGLPGMAILLLLPGLLRALGYNADLASDVGGYLAFLALGLIPYTWVTVLRFTTAAIGRPRVGTLIAILGVGVEYVIGSWLLDHGYGLKGVGLSITIGIWVMLGCFALYVRFEKHCRRYAMLWRPNAGNADLKELWTIGWPISVAFAAETLLFSTSSTMAGFFTSIELAAHTIANQSIVSTFMVAVGLSHATMVRVAHAVGQGAQHRVRRIGLTGIGLGLVGMGCSATLFFTAGEWVVGRFIDLDVPGNLPTLAFAPPLLIIAGIFQLVDGTQAVAAAALRGIQDVRSTMVIGLFSYWAVGLVSAWVMAFPLGMRTQGLWLGLAVGLATAAVALTARFLFLTRDLTKPGLAR
ncbi:MATE family efflux transporter [Lacibacterium aquatile]|uniref:MATE family efflux transporter n=1 Tax=Lacibacterium aquatile TaxID=1168082 RepID=A0ABW5DUU8_9PROT